MILNLPPSTINSCKQYIELLNIVTFVSSYYRKQVFKKLTHTKKSFHIERLQIELSEFPAQIKRTLPPRLYQNDKNVEIQ